MQVMTQSWRGCNALYVARKCGLSNGLQLVLDAGDAGSYTSGDKWLDLSGSGYDFHRGLDATTDGTEPTFNGTAGRLSSAEYWSFDGADLFRYDSTNETWMNNIHKSGALWGFYTWVYIDSSSGLIGNNGSATGDIGFHLICGSFGGGTFTLSVRVLNGSDTIINQGISSVPQNTWRLLGCSVDATGANTSFLFDSGRTATFDGTYASPSASDATYTTEIGSRGNDSLKISSGGRMGMTLCWSGVFPTLGQVQAFYNATRGRYGV